MSRAALLPLLLLAACGTTRPATDAGAFLDARAVALDPAGRAYVVDGDRGLCGETAAGWACTTGAEEGRLVDPVALDASDGLTVLVADRIGRIVRFDRAGVVRDVLTLPPSASRTGEAPRFAPVAVVRDELGRPVALDPVVGVVRWDAARQLSLVVPPERLPRAARALVRDGAGFAVLGAGVLVRFDAFGTETGRATTPAEALALATDGAHLFAVGTAGVVAVAPGVAPRPAQTPGSLVGAAGDARRWCELTRTDLRCVLRRP